MHRLIGWKTCSTLRFIHCWRLEVEDWSLTNVFVHKCETGGSKRWSRPVAMLNLYIQWDKQSNTVQFHRLFSWHAMHHVFRYIYILKYIYQLMYTCMCSIIPANSSTFFSNNPAMYIISKKKMYRNIHPIRIQLWWKSTNGNDNSLVLLRQKGESHCALYR